MRWVSVAGLTVRLMLPTSPALGDKWLGVKLMVRTRRGPEADCSALFRIGDQAEDAGDHQLARRSFERGAELGDLLCLDRLAYHFDVGFGGKPDKPLAMRYYRRAWRLGSDTAGNNIAILYREAGNRRAMFRWFERALERGDSNANLELAKCYLGGMGVRKSVRLAVRHLAAAVSSDDISEASREEAKALLAQFRPALVEA